MTNHWSAVTALCVWCAVLSAPASSQPSAVFSIPPPQSSSSLAAEIETAAADRVYAVEMTFAPRTSVGELRAVATEVDVLRIFAFVEHTVGDGSARQGSVMLALGRSYDGNAAGQHSECQSLLQLRSMGNALSEVPIDEWPVGRVHLSATAYAVRDLLRGIRLAGATLVSGTAVPHEHLRTIERGARTVASQPIPNPSDVELPPYCSQFVVAANEPYLSGGFPLGFQPPAASPGESFRDAAFRVLAALPPNMAVTIHLKLNPGVEVDELAALVRDYQVRGMQAGLLPARSVQRMEADAQLSTHGDLSAQVRRVQCLIRMTEERGHASGAWRSDWIGISLSADDAARLLFHPGLAQAAVSGAQPLPELDRLAGYYERLAAQIYEMPRTWPIPTGCGSVYVHGDYDDEGSVHVGRAP